MNLIENIFKDSINYDLINIFDLSLILTSNTVKVLNYSYLRYVLYLKYILRTIYTQYVLKE